MTTEAELRTLIDRARQRGAILRTRIDRNGYIDGVSVGRVPGGEYRRLGAPGTGWLPPIAAAERLRAMLTD